MQGLGGIPYMLPQLERPGEVKPPEKVSPTGKLVLFIIALWIVPTTAILFLRWGSLYLILPYVTMLSVSYVLFKPRGDVKVWRIVQHNRFLEGQEFEVEVHVKPEFSVDHLLVEDVVPPGLELISGSPSRVFSLRAGEEGALKYRVRIRRGVHTFEKTRIAYRDPFGFFSSDGLAEVYTEVIGVPILYDVQTPYSTRGTKITIGPLPSPLVGEGLEFHAVREYQPGDPLKIINWKATARTGRVMANEFESERKVDVVFVVDASLSSGAVFDHLIRAAASLMLNALNDGTSFGLLLSEEIPLWVRVDYGKRHFFKCTDFLSTARPDKSNMIAYQVEHLVRRAFPPRAQVLYFSTLTTPESRRALEVLADHGYRVVVISPDPNSVYKPKDEAERLAMRLVRVKRKALIRSLAGYGVIVDWDVGKPLKVAIAEAIGR